VGAGSGVAKGRSSVGLAACGRVCACTGCVSGRGAPSPAAGLRSGLALGKAAAHAAEPKGLAFRRHGCVHAPGTATVNQWRGRTAARGSCRKARDGGLGSPMGASSVRRWQQDKGGNGKGWWCSPVGLGDDGLGAVAR